MNISLKNFCPVRIVSLLSLFLMYSCNQNINEPEIPHYTNPLYTADFPDPDPIKVGNDFYMVTSSFPYSPGLPIYHSRDLVHWRIITNVFQNHPNKYFDVPRHGQGVYAPSIRYRENLYYIFYGDPDFGIYVSKAKHPEGPWSEPKLIAEGKGWIDPCPFWDDDGNAYMVRAWAKSRSGINSILTLHKMSPEGDSLLDEGKMIFDGTKTQPIIEGSKMYKRNGYYYIFAPAGSVPLGWQTVLRSKNIYGPYEEKIVMHQGITPFNGPHQGGWVELESGECWFLHFQDHEAYGRILHLNPMKWRSDDWPVIGIDKDGDGLGEPVVSHPYPKTGNKIDYTSQRTSDEFNEAVLAPQWRWQANFRKDWYSLTDNPGSLTLKAHPVNDPDLNILNIPQVLTQRFPAEEFEITTLFNLNSLDESNFAGLAVTGNNYADLRISRKDDITTIQYLIRYQANTGGIGQVLSTSESPSGTIYLRITVKKGGICTFSFSDNGTDFQLAGSGFKAQKLRWVGSSVGLYCITTADQPDGGSVEIDWFRVENEENNL